MLLSKGLNVLVLLRTGACLGVRAIHVQQSSLCTPRQATRCALLLCRDAQERAAAAKAAADISSPKAAEAGATPAGKKGVKKGDKGSKAPEDVAAKANWQKWQESNVRWAGVLCWGYSCRAEGRQERGHGQQGT